MQDEVKIGGLRFLGPDKEGRFLVRVGIADNREVTVITLVEGEVDSWKSAAAIQEIIWQEHRRLAKITTKSIPVVDSTEAAKQALEKPNLFAAMFSEASEILVLTDALGSTSMNNPASRVLSDRIAEHAKNLRYMIDKQRLPANDPEPEGGVRF